jgi:hypothetical protein
MVSIFYDEVVSLAEKLTPEEREALGKRLLEKPEKPKMSAEEFRQWFESLAFDAGAVLEGYSDRREDWYGDDGR